MIYASDIGLYGQCKTISAPTGFDTLDQVIGVMGPPDEQSDHALQYGNTIFSDYLLWDGKGTTYFWFTSGEVLP